MKLNNKGFAISTIMYMILIMGLVLITLTLSLLSNRKFILDKTKEEAKDNIYSICKAVTNKTVTTGNVPKGNYEKGDEYICEVKPGTNYRFFIISTEDNKVNLIMNRNITSEGTEATFENKGIVAWNSNGSNLDGPVTAFNFLYEATKDWINIENIKINYYDEGGYYSSIITSNNITEIKDKEGNITGSYENLKVRMPKKNELTDFNGNNLWMWNYLKNYGNDKSYNGYDWGEGLVNIDGISGYWTLASSFSEIFGHNSAWDADYGGSVYNSDYVAMNNTYDYKNGVRPVISISIDRIR